ncbi:hypothetical protein FNV43_RR13960 [Rhamnella rubrinervis]|uniref:Uncharacterized protein n=1 Tax=Rhamnella rubrinervis TaxID=2594499 RepID=A0A8K0H2A9_9ROSA|nr:hypothetical protein FNV43_RR13960 [Rhamnella rubrinervis]
MAEKPNGGVYVEVAENDGASSKPNRSDETLFCVLCRLISSIIAPDPSTLGDTRFLQRIKNSLAENVPLLRQASRNTARNVFLWTRRGSPLRALLVISVGTITLLALTGLLVFMLFFVAATFNAIIISLLMSLAAAGGFLAFFFVCVTAIYIGALSVAVFVISTTTIITIVAVLIATGWIGFFWTVWLATKTSVGFAKHTLGATGSAISAYSTARHARRYQDPNKISD